MKKRLVSLLLTLALLGALTTPAAAYSTAALVPQVRTYDAPFTDLTAPWYRDAVQTCYEAGLMSGKSDARFDPNGTLSYAEIFVIAARMHSLFHGGDGTLPSPAPGQPWYQGAVEYFTALIGEEPDAAEDGDFAEEDYGEFWYIEYTLPELMYYAEEPCDRLTFVVLLEEVLPETALEPINNITFLPDVSCDDFETISFYNAGIVTGTDAYGTFSGFSNLTRAEAAVMLARIVDPGQRVKLDLKPYVPSEYYLGLAPDTPLMTVDGYTVTAGVYLYALLEAQTWYIIDRSLLKTMFPEEYQEYLEWNPEGGPGGFVAYFEDTYGVYIFDQELDWTIKIGKSGKSMAERLFPIARRCAVRNACILNREGDYPLTEKEKQNCALYSKAALDSDAAKENWTTQYVINHIYDKCTPSDAEIRKRLEEQGSLYGTPIGVPRPESENALYSRYETDAEAKAELERIHQQIQQHSKEEDYIQHLHEKYNQIFTFGPDFYDLSPFSEANQRTLRNLPEGQVSPVLPEDDFYFIWYKNPLPLSDLTDKMSKEAANELIDQWADSASVTATEAYKTLDPNQSLSREIYNL